jgi:predicted DNA binding protein
MLKHWRQRAHEVQDKLRRIERSEQMFIAVGTNYRVISFDELCNGQQAKEDKPNDSGCRWKIRKILSAK